MDGWMNETFDEEAKREWETNLTSGICPYKIGIVKIASSHEKNAIQKLEMRILVHSLTYPWPRGCVQQQQ